MEILQRRKLWPSERDFVLGEVSFIYPFIHSFIHPSVHLANIF